MAHSRNRSDVDSLRAHSRPGSQIRVTDTGRGIPPEKLEHIFDTFSQADNSITREFGGSGLGLAICSRLVGLMAGTIDVESELAKGTSFTVALPLPAAAEQPDPPQLVVATSMPPSPP